MIMPHYRKIYILLATSLAGVIACLFVMGTAFTYPLDPVAGYAMPRYAVLDISTVIAGMRRFGADIAWIQLLQYYGSPEEALDRDTEFKLSWDMTKYLFGMPVEKEKCHKEGCADREHYHPPVEGGVYAGFLGHCSRVAGLDPFFSYVYLYGAGALAWNLNRPDEAVTLLQRGIAAMERFEPNITRDARHPFWQLHLYLAAIAYQKAGATTKMTGLLETAVTQPGAPNMIKAILASIYQKDKKLMPALKLWLDIYDSKDPTYRARAEHKLAELKQALQQ
jgi:hypothetical protein